ncbi:exosome complex component RRP40-like [Temnothorax curvispinosus]|uniref:Exosome complex component RRP40 n=1 Tax=Temnothorax curvispinosus TaxID=300111 RepID=A0A6J1QKN1_9HYME|nr:exosome complex component RRP40-like [Temnothorax curvispinosus]XP_024869399.1 exosome complex component RRP40-like [Temnothorax curvispinosus]XP_024882981.1 exosome complex component RRP40-like [Temnothorax curvispinosus]XP_024882982.1 exosome complex component RRP40-like [Temnothorax curvispinosus]XP_024882983.1 exosome complex component RRP40-like [Temnothorax curvispinosus]XP_024882984.1 exosome complex component RRP40-like [Temnothorax curvispinosus]
MEVDVGDVVMPGDSLNNITPLKKEGRSEKEFVILGPGLRREGDSVLVCKAGVLRKRDPAVYYVDSYQKRYIPNRGENVVGIVTQKSGDIFKVDIGASEQATLSYLAFEGATKKNRPDVQIGDVVYAKLLVASKDMEPELVCVDSQGKENELGVLSSDGMMFTCSLSLVRKLLNPECPLFRLLGRNQAYEIAAGMNGRIWIKAQSVKETIAVANAILASEYTVPSEMQKLCARIEKVLLLVA